MRGRLAEIRFESVIDVDAMAGLVDAADAIAAEEGVRAVLMSGDAWSSAGIALPVGTAGPDGVAAVAGIAVPTIALLHGPVSGIGLSLALACDLRVATRDARLSLSDDDGGPLGSGALARLTRLIGPARAAEMALLGRSMTARAGLDWGLLTAVVDRADLRAAGRRLAAQLVARGPLGLRFAKEAVVRALDLPLDDGIRLEHDLYVLLQTTADRREGVDAFLAHRPPRFHGR